MYKLGAFAEGSTSSYLHEDEWSGILKQVVLEILSKGIVPEALWLRQGKMDGKKLELGIQDECKEWIKGLRDSVICKEYGLIDESHMSKDELALSVPVSLNDIKLGKIYKRGKERESLYVCIGRSSSIQWLDIGNTGLNLTSIGCTGIDWDNIVKEIASKGVGVDRYYKDRLHSKWYELASNEAGYNIVFPREVRRAIKDIIQASKELRSKQQVKIGSKIPSIEYILRNTKWVGNKENQVYI